MQEKLYTHVPVYERLNSGGVKYCGVLTETTVLDWLVESLKKGRAEFIKSQIRDFNKKYLHSQGNICLFVSPSFTVFDLIRAFESHLRIGKRLGAVIITRTGKKDELPIGIVTAWDLPQVERELKKD